ncbi:MAG: YeeE/YedE family protein [Anaerolineae bacterium]|nr:YeeE/YedE family protein [Anaerolineae bacterium]
MMTFPLPLESLLGQWGAYGVYLLIGIAFGAVLEMAGFAVSTKLAAQFYFKDMTVLKVMFTGIVVAMLLVFLATGLGLLDYNLVYVNPTYLWPGILGGLIMGVGFILGGFCPGTSLVAAATLKLDGILFALGAFFGIFLFGETVGFYEPFWNSSYMGRFTLMELFNSETGVIVVAVVLMALAAFALSEVAERVIGKQGKAIRPRWRYGLAGGAVALSVAVAFIGQPSNADRWNMLEAEKQPLLDARAVYVHPAEMLTWMNDPKIVNILVDVRSEAEYNLFHIRDARHVPYAELDAVVEEFNALPDNALVFVMSSDEVQATQAWKYLIAEGVVNVYILEGGVNNWITLYGEGAFAALPTPAADALAYAIPIAYGASHPAASPHADRFLFDFEKKVVLTLKRGPASGGCG